MCTPTQRKLCVGNCDICFNHSFASIPFSTYWSIDNKLRARSVVKNSANNYKFDCDVCFHSFYAKPNNITSNSSKCPYCSDKILCDDNDCVCCFEKSFA